MTAINNPAASEHAAAVTPNDSADLPGGNTKGLYVGVSGNLNVDMGQGDTVLFSNVPVGVLPISVKRVRATSTTATNIVALY